MSRFVNPSKRHFLRYKDPRINEQIKNQYLKQIYQINDQVKVIKAIRIDVNLLRIEKTQQRKYTKIKWNCIHIHLKSYFSHSSTKNVIKWEFKPISQILQMVYTKSVISKLMHSNNIQQQLFHSSLMLLQIQPNVEYFVGFRLKGTGQSTILIEDQN
ncbi:unnamed protein product (macronuclear) [Paramecium tetraurelia]|uniref:Uncharacterized protein n=1 Tax=Paramecium tetraurelia TaxID=5888 RepID=A0BVD5_PARTE|nr:uncharacterized protein GSPATT00005748001 [Paramecium tetraurelia]CAK62502.1 unnamed protein product [Paramecium tetraurelia]|eukprot:XP_001429900.1 hypothetical protein (macronuclear) [Paramecium tetraurelia strain d4-2]